MSTGKPHHIPFRTILQSQESVQAAMVYHMEIVSPLYRSYIPAACPQTHPIRPAGCKYINNLLHLIKRLYKQHIGHLACLFYYPFRFILIHNALELPRAAIQMQSSLLHPPLRRPRRTYISYALKRVLSGLQALRQSL